MVSSAFTVVIPAYNEAGCIADLVREVLAACAEIDLAEVIVVDDHSTDNTSEEVLSLAAGDPRLKAIRHETNAGQSAAVHTGVLAATSAYVCTMDGDGQNPPVEIPKLVAKLLSEKDRGVGLVAGQRVNRQDTLSKKWASKFANGLRQRMLRDETRDTGCGLKAFRRDAYLRLPYFDHMHRYLPALFARDGWGVAHVDVTHRSRETGVSKYNNVQRGLVGAVDLLGVAWLIRRKKKASVNAQTLSG